MNRFMPTVNSWLLKFSIMIALSIACDGRTKSAETFGPFRPETDKEKIANIFRFLDRFCSDSTFQVRHVQFPLPVEITWFSAGGEDSTVIEYVTSTDWTHHDFTNEKDYGGRLYYGITVGVEDTGIHIEYRFERGNTGWRLTRIFDGSN